MKKYTLLLALALILQVSASSQSCLPDGIIFTTQMQIDSFQINYPNCSMVEGDIEISGDDITNLDSLVVLTVIDGDLFVGYTTMLASLSGLNNVTSIGQTIRIYMNSALTSLSGLDNIVTIGQNLRITNNDVLANINALSSLTSVGENLRIYMNSELTSLSGLENLTTVGDNLRITNNSAITSLSALFQLTSINGELVIENNDALESLEGIDNIDSETITDVAIRNNLLLSTCEVQSVCNYLATPNGDISIHDNTIGCNSNEEVIEACVEGVEETTRPEITIYPNPARDELTITNEHDIIVNEIVIYNAMGQKVMSVRQATNTIDVSILTKGMYVIEIVSNKFTVRKKLILK